ncbi:hypothetical protein ACF09I_34595 [Streptomyces sp. NPDC014940]|uniref:hypothetical protein n=1 Tax=Streptomyces sp. NPDC014940 TaxID=3364932 RepID=UPI0036F793EA
MSINSDMAMRRFTSNAGRNLSQLEKDSEAGSKALGELKKATLLLSPAAIPAAASLAPIAAGALTVGAAVAAMGAAIVPQISALGDISEAQKKYDDAVQKNGAHSKEAATAQAELAQTVARVPKATREAAASVSVLKDEYKQWSDSLAGDTMAPLTKGIAIVNALLPKTTGLVKATSAETDRFMTIIGGEMASPGLDRLDKQFTTFAQKTLRSVNDELVHLLRTSDGKVGGGATEFMTWARAQGPVVASVLKDVSLALFHVLRAGSDVGVGMLQVVEVLAHLVSAVPPSAIATFLQLALALKVTKAAVFGMAAGRTAIAGFATQLIAMQAAAGAAPGRLRAVGAAIGAMSRSVKVAVAGTGIGLLLIALHELSQQGKQAPPDIDRMTTALGKLGQTGKVTGEAGRVLGQHLEGLSYAVDRVAGKSEGMDKFNDVMNSIFSLGMKKSNSFNQAKDDIDALDEGLSNLVKGGKADLAAAALKRLEAGLAKKGVDPKELTKNLDAYKSALADAALEAELTAASQGLFGQQAQAVQEKLNAQKASADGLRQSLQALNDVNRQGLGGMIGFESAIDAAAKGAKDYHDVLTMSNGQLSLGNDKQRQAAQLLSDLADKTESAAASQRDAGASWETVNGIYKRGRDNLIANARAMGLNRTEAAQLADQILKIPNKKAKVSMETEDARASLDAFIRKVEASPKAKSVTLKTLSAGAEKILESFGYKVTHLKDGSVRVSALTGTALSNLYAVKRARDSLSDKSITITTNRVTKFTSVQGGVTVAKRDYATGGRVGFPGGGPISGPGTGTSDSIPINVSNGEYVVNAKSTAKYRGLIEAINADRLGTGGGRGMPGAGAAVAAGLAQGMTGSTATVDAAARAMAAAVTTGVKAELQIASPSKKTKALAHDVGKGFISGLTGSRDKIRSVAKDLAKDIKTAFSGHKESSLLRYVDKQTDKLLHYASKRDKIAARIKEAKSFAHSTTRTAKESAGLSNLGMDEDHITAGGIKAGLASKLSKIRQFTKYVEILSKRGLNKTLLKQILNMGPDAGYAYASALVGADKATFKQINSMQSTINKSSDHLGKVGADRLYDSGKNAGKGFLKGLEGQQKHIEDLMLKIAKGMQKAIKKALGIKSPSTVMAQLGDYSTQGLARGLVDGMPHLDRALSAVSARVAATRPVIGRPAAAAARPLGAPIHITIEGALDPYAVARQIETVLTKYRRGRGGLAFNFG